MRRSNVDTVEWLLADRRPKALGKTSTKEVQRVQLLLQDLYPDEEHFLRQTLNASVT